MTSKTAKLELILIFTIFGMGYSIGAIRRVLGIFFISIAIGVALAASLTEIAFRYHAPDYIYPIIWIGILTSTISVSKLKHPDMFKLISWRFKQSTNWSIGLKAINGICWAVPFAVIPIFPDYYSYLILLGIGLGNTCTYFITRKTNSLSFPEQLIVGAISLAALPVMIFLGSLHTLSSDMLQFLARLFIAFAYGTGGAYTFTIDVI